MTTPVITPVISTVELGGSPSSPLLVVGPSLGTSAETLWSASAAALAEDHHVVGWDLPGHGRSPAAEDFDVADVAAGVLTAVETVLAARGEPGGSFDCAGDSLGGAVALQLALDVPDRVRTLVMLCSGARIGEPDAWHDRAATVRGSGTAAVVELSAARWFGPGFLDREPGTGSALLEALRDTDAASYAAACDALAVFDLRPDLSRLSVPVLAVAGAHDQATPVATLREVAEGVPAGRLMVLDGAAHMAPAEAPETVAGLIRLHLHPARADMSDPLDAGYAVRREVLGDAHVDRSVAAATDFSRDFQELITRYAWGSIWARPGLDRRSRSLITLTAMVAGGHHEELAMHVRAAGRNGVTADEIKELLLQTAIYCGVPAANTAFRIAQDVLELPDS